MKKSITFLMCIIMIFALLTGCSKGENVAITPLGADELQKSNVFTEVFKSLVSEASYTMELKEEKAMDNDITLNVFNIKNTKKDETCQLRLYTDKDSKVIWVFLISDREKNTNSSLAKISFCAYKAMGMPQMSQSEFYDKYDLLSSGNIFEIQGYGKYDIISMTMSTSNENTFTIRSTEYGV